MEWGRPFGRLRVNFTVIEHPQDAGHQSFLTQGKRLYSDLQEGFRQIIKKTKTKRKV